MSSTTTQQVRKTKTVQQFMKHHFRHFNAAVVVDAAEAYQQHIA